MPAPQPGKAQQSQHAGEPQHPDPQADVPRLSQVLYVSPTRYGGAHHPREKPKRSPVSVHYATGQKPVTY